MIVCDLTHAYTPTSGGIRTYVDAKRQYVLEHTDHTHVLVVPGEEDSQERGERWATYRIKSPVIPGAAPYRFFLRYGAIVEALREATPLVVAVHTPFTELWSALRFRDRHARRALVSGFYHTDLTGAYVGSTARKFAGSFLGERAERLSKRYVRSAFARCDLVLAPSTLQTERLARIGIPNAHSIELGVDLETFHPGRRDAAVRAELGVPEDTLLLFYAGRLDAEKRVFTMADAVARVNRERPAHLVMAGNGPHRKALIERSAAGVPLTVLPYQEDKLRLARLMASSDLYLTAGPHETFGLSVVEAQACGLPVVGVAAGALIERVDEATGRLGPMDDAVAMAANVLAVAANREAMGTQARRRVEAQYSWRATFDHLFSLYDVERRRTAPPLGF